MGYKLRYFDIRGKGEPIRLILAHAGQEFEDERIEHDMKDPANGREWLEKKPGTLWGVVPELECDGFRLCQTMAIIRYLGTKFGLVGSKPEEIAYVDMLLCCVEDVVNQIGQLMSSVKKDNANTVELITEKSQKFQDMLKRFNGFLVANNDGNKWLVGDNITVADIYASCAIPYLAMFYPNIFDDYPKVQALFKRVEEQPNIAAWIAKRPQTLL